MRKMPGTCVKTTLTIQFATRSNKKQRKLRKPSYLLWVYHVVFPQCAHHFGTQFGCMRSQFDYGGTVNESPDAFSLVPVLGLVRWRIVVKKGPNASDRHRAVQLRLQT